MSTASSVPARCGSTRAGPAPTPGSRSATRSGSRRCASRRPQRRAPPAPAREFPVVFEDDALLAIDKPAGVAVHGGSGVSFGVIEQLRRARPEAQFLELVHRLDKETSGLLLIAKKRSALVALQNHLRARAERAIGKTYAALVVGAWPDTLKVIDVALHKYLDRRRRAPRAHASTTTTTTAGARSRWSGSRGASPASACST